MATKTEKKTAPKVKLTKQGKALLKIMKTRKLPKHAEAHKAFYEKFIWPANLQINETSKRGADPEKA